MTAQKRIVSSYFIAFTSLYLWTDPAYAGPILDEAVAADWVYA